LSAWIFLSYYKLWLWYSNRKKQESIKTHSYLPANNEIELIFLREIQQSVTQQKCHCPIKFAWIFGWPRKTLRSFGPDHEPCWLQWFGKSKFLHNSSLTDELESGWIHTYIGNGKRQTKNERINVFAFEQTKPILPKVQMLEVENWCVVPYVSHIKIMFVSVCVWQ
jgi:hypothetical protein